MVYGLQKSMMLSEVMFIWRDKKILSFPVTCWDFSGSVGGEKIFLPEKSYQSFLVNTWNCFIYLIIKAHTEHVLINLNKMVSLKTIITDKEIMKS